MAQESTCCITLLDTSRRDTGSQPSTAKLFFSFSLLFPALLCVCVSVCVPGGWRRGERRWRRGVSQPTQCERMRGEHIYTHKERRGEEKRGEEKRREEKRREEKEIGLGRTRSTIHASHKANESPDCCCMAWQTAFSSFTQAQSSQGSEVIRLTNHELIADALDSTLLPLYSRLFKSFLSDLNCLSVQFTKLEIESELCLNLNSV